MEEIHTNWTPVFGEPIKFMYNFYVLLTNHLDNDRVNHHNARLDGIKANRNGEYLNFGEEDEMEISGYVTNKSKQYLTIVFYLLTFGFLRLVFHWYPQWKLNATHSRCALDNAEKVLIVARYKAKYRSYFVEDVKILTNSSSVKDGDEDDDDDDDDALLLMHLSDGSKRRMSRARTVRVKKLLYFWNDVEKKFMKLCGLDKGIKNREFRDFKGYSEKRQTLIRSTYGINEINVPVQSISTLLILEVLTPFYIFQLFSLVVWLAELYYYYAIAILIMSITGITTSIIQTRRNQKQLKGTVHLSDKIQVIRNDRKVEEVPTSHLVPGDVMIIPPHGCDMQCDAVLLNGICIVNESMLTGESVPITKTSLPSNDEFYDVTHHSNHTIFCGTRVIQTRYYGDEHVLAVVTRTGYLTAKGELIRSILYPPPADFKFDQDSYKFIIILAVIAAIGFLYTISSKITRNISPLDILIKALDVLTIAIPPALPAAMTVGKLYALNRLKESNIYCINSRVINVSGSVNCFCFDKTGTLTEDGLDMWGAVPIKKNILLEPVRNVCEDLPKSSLLFQGMVTCHSLTLIDDEICGDPLEVKMFQATGWILEEPSIPDSTKYDLLVPTIFKPMQTDFSHMKIEIGLIQQFPFSSTLQRMSVITKTVGTDHFQIFCKGSPEMIISLSNSSTIPDDIVVRLREYTEKGYRVIGMGTRKLADVPFHKINRLHREEIECDLDFVGLIIFENRLKPQTTKVIETLHKAGMKIVMITGDNIQTAVSVARECGIIRSGYSIVDVITTQPSTCDKTKIEYHLTEPVSISYSKVKEDREANPKRKYHLVVSGNTWEHIITFNPELIPKIITKGVVFARMFSHQKQQLIEELQSLGYYVGEYFIDTSTDVTSNFAIAMCGDGANDCGALKAAHVGISLSEAESSVASPFTSRDANISCSEKIVKEGRAALVTSFGVFKIMLCYSLTELNSVLILYSIDSNLSSLQFLFIDICLVLNFSSFFGKTRAYPKLHKNPPMISLLDFVPLMSIVFFMVITIVSSIVAFFAIQQFSWFSPFQFDSSNQTRYTSYENYAVFTASLFQYITLVVVYSKGKPFRKAVYTNYLLMSSLISMTIICIYITMYPAQWVEDALELISPPEWNGKITILVIGFVTFILNLIAEDFIVDYLLGEVMVSKLKRFGNDRLKYLEIERELDENPIWPTDDVQILVTKTDEKRTNGVTKF